MFFNVTGDGSNLNFGDIFGDILTDITSSAAQGSTHVGDEDPTQGGYLTYTDPIGEYMEVKAVKAMIINDVIYRNSSKTTSAEGVTTYVFSGTANNPVYGAQELRHIIITVTEGTDGNETLEVKISAALLPLRLTTVLKDSDGNVVRYAHNSTFPFRLVYSVGLKKGVLNDDGSVNMNVVSEAYIETHTVDGKVQFYAGKYSGTPEKGNVGNQDRTIGDAVVTYVPSRNNPFYFVTENTPLYVLSDGKYVRATSNLDPNETYYFQISYYVASDGGNHVAHEYKLWVSRPGSSIRAESTDSDSDGLYLKANAPRLGNLNDFLKEKRENNNTDTAQIYLYIYYPGTGADESENVDEHFEVYHGNNGRLSAELPSGTLSVTKNVVNGEKADKKEFKFEITLTHTDDASHHANIEIGGVTFTNGVGHFTLKNNETKVFDIAQDHNGGVEWTVEEITDYSDAESRWSTTVTGDSGDITVNGNTASGTLGPGDSQAVTFTNTYSTPTGTLTVAKVVEGDTAQADTQLFSFKLTVEDLGEDDTVTSGDDTISFDEAGSYTFTLSGSQSRKFTIPEEVTWTVEETQALNANWTTTVSGSESTGTSDNLRSASGTIEAGDNDIVTFTNKYTAPGALEIIKSVRGEDSNKQYEFTVELEDAADKPVSGTFGDITFTDGQATIYLSDGDSATIQGLPADTKWTVTETSQNGEGWTTTVNGKSVKAADGVITGGGLSSVEFVNSAPGKLTVTKTVKGDNAPTDEFNFTLTYGDETETFTLSKDGSETFTIPADTAYTVTEEALGEGWTCEHTNDTGVILAGTSTTAAFVNTYTEPEEPEEPEAPEEPEEPERPENPGTVPPQRPSNQPEEPSHDGPQLEREDHFGYIVGRTEGEVFPNANMTRAEVATIFFRLLTDESRAEYWSSENGFTDVDGSAWYNNAVSTMANAGVINGYEDGTFRPDANITRAEFAAMAVRFYGEVSEYGEDYFNDISGTWARNYINRAHELGLVGGYEDGGFHPDANITRAEAIKIINGVLGRKPEAGHLHEDMKVWTDNLDESAWYYADVQEATNSHTYDMGSEYETWTGIEPLRDWEALEREWSNAYGNAN